MATAEPTPMLLDSEFDRVVERPPGSSPLSSPTPQPAAAVRWATGSSSMHWVSWVLLHVHARAKPGGHSVRHGWQLRVSRSQCVVPATQAEDGTAAHMQCLTTPTRGSPNTAFVQLIEPVLSSTDQLSLMPYRTAPRQAQTLCSALQKRNRVSASRTWHPTSTTPVLLAVAGGGGRGVASGIEGSPPPAGSWSPDVSPEPSRAASGRTGGGRVTHRLLSGSHSQFA